MKVLLPLLCLLLAACSGSRPKTDDYMAHVASNLKLADSQPLIVQLDVKQPLDVRGEYNPANGIESGQMMYMGDAGIIGLFAQIATHAAVNSNLQDAKLSQQQQAANTVLRPLESVLSAMTNQLLIHKTDSIQFNGSGADVTHSKPIFFMSQDKKTLILRHLVTIELPMGKSSRKAAARYQNIIEVASTSNTEANPDQYWAAEQGAALKQTATALYEKSLQIVREDVQGKLGQNVGDQTLSFQFGSQVRTERGKLLQQDCDYALIRNLRGWLMAIPTTALKNNAVACQEPSTGTLPTTG
jgi:hypothetical protein